MGKGTEVDRITGEKESSRPRRPLLKLRPDTPAVELNESTRVADIIAPLSPREFGVALRDPSGEVQAMVVPIERYIEMASATIEGDKHFDLDPTRFPPQNKPSPDYLAALHVEQINPDEYWQPGTGPTQSRGCLGE